MDFGSFKRVVRRGFCVVSVHFRFEWSKHGREHVRQDEESAVVKEIINKAV